MENTQRCLNERGISLRLRCFLGVRTFGALHKFSDLTVGLASRYPKLKAAMNFLVSPMNTSAHN